MAALLGLRDAQSALGLALRRQALDGDVHTFVDWRGHGNDELWKGNGRHDFLCGWVKSPERPSSAGLRELELAIHYTNLKKKSRLTDTQKKHTIKA